MAIPLGSSRLTGFSWEARLRSRPGTRRSPAIFTWVRVVVVSSAGGLGVGMLLENVQHGPLDPVTVLEALVGWSFVACGVFIWARESERGKNPLSMTVCCCLRVC